MSMSGHGNGHGHGLGGHGEDGGGGEPNSDVGTMNINLGERIRMGMGMAMGIGSLVGSDNEETISNLAKQAADVIWSPYSSVDQINLIGLPVAIYHLLVRKGAIYIKRDALSDVQFIMAGSFLLSLIRVLLVQMLVPRYLAPRRLAAFVQSKSTHLLSSSEYMFARKGNGNDSGDGDGKNVDLASMANNNSTSAANSNASGIPVRRYINGFLRRTGKALRRSLGHESQSPYDEMDASQALRLFSAPRYATAIFRLLFCLFSCFWALANFSSANFWPVWVGGQRAAHTKNCWDLSGSVALHGASLDSDFDHQNSALRYFFLGQASYQIHSICFHILSMMLLMIYGGENGYLSARQSLRSYSRPMLEHTIYFILTVTTYIFSGLRRLGAITIFALETSSMILQFLQICINAPETSAFRNDRMVKFIHHFLAVPVFIYCRFFIMPFIVQYSAAFESSMWLQQIEKAFQPGVGMVIYVFFNGMLLLAFGLNFEYLRRLLFHPFVTSLHKFKDGKVD